MQSNRPPHVETTAHAMSSKKLLEVLLVQARCVHEAAHYQQLSLCLIFLHIIFYFLSQGHESGQFTSPGVCRQCSSRPWLKPNSEKQPVRKCQFVAPE